jgi:hypothetical protein
LTSVGLLKILWHRTTNQAVSQRSLQDRVWAAGWPEDRGVLADALAIAAAFPVLVGPFQVFLSGDSSEALGRLVADLKSQGISESDLPDVALVPARDCKRDLPHIGGLPLALALLCEHGRRASVPAFPSGDARRGKVWMATTCALAEVAVATATVITDSLDCFEDLASGRVTVVSGCPLTRRLARRKALTAVPRPPSSRHLPAATYVVLDARRPDDLALAAGTNAQPILVNTEGISNLALRALGVSQSTTTLTSIR